MSGHSGAAGAGPRRRDLLAGLGAAGLGAAGLATMLPGRARAAGDSFTLRGATVLTHEGKRLDDHGLKVEDGRVVALEPSARFGADGTDLSGAWVCPGFTDAGCLVGLVEVGQEDATHDDDESSNAVTPDARVRDGYNVRSEVIPVTRANGITSVLVHPAGANLISGQAALLRTAGDTVDEALMLAPAALCINLGRGVTGKGRNGAPASRMGVAMRLREILEETKLPAEKDPNQDTKRKPKREVEGGKDKDVKPDSEVEPAKRALRDLKRGTLPALIQAERADDILFALDLARSWKLDAILLGAAEAWLVADAIAAASVPVFLGPLSVQPDSFEHLEARYENAALLHKAGVRLAFRTGAVHFSRGLPTNAGLAVAYGLPFEAAITALTRGPHEALGLDSGRLEPGAEATFFTVAGDPLQPRNALGRMWIAGRELPLSSRQSRLYDRFRTL